MSKVVTGFKIEDTEVANLRALSELLGTDVSFSDVEEGGQYSDIVTILYGEPHTYLNEEVKATKDDVLSSLPEFANLDDLKEFIKQLDNETLEFIVKGLGLSWTPTYHANIHRMRMAVSLHKFFFPELFVPKEDKTSKKHPTLEQLQEEASTRGLEIELTGDPRLDKVRLLSALK